LLQQVPCLTGKKYFIFLPVVLSNRFGHCFKNVCIRVRSALFLACRETWPTPSGSKFSGCHTVHMQDEFGRRWWNTELKARCWFEAPGEITTFTQSDSTEKYQFTTIYCWLCRYAHPPIAHNSWDAFSSAVRPICAPNPAGAGQASPWAQMPTSRDWFKPCFFWGLRIQRKDACASTNSYQFAINRHWKNHERLRTDLKCWKRVDSGRIFLVGGFSFCLFGPLLFQQFLTIMSIYISILRGSWNRQPGQSLVVKCSYYSLPPS
jgi:hypothetical protein